MTGNSYPKQQYRRPFTHNMQGKLAALADWGVVLQSVYIEFRLQITTPKIRNFASLVQREVVFARKPDGLTLMRDWPWYDKLICKQTYNRISYINKMFTNLSVSYRRQLSLPKRALLLVRFELLIYSQTILPKTADFIENYKFISFESTLPVVAKRSHHPPLHREGKFRVVKRPVYIKFRLETTTPKITDTASLVPIGHNM